MSSDPPIRSVRSPELEGLPIIDCDVHNVIAPLLAEYLPARWQHHLETVGLRNRPPFGSISTQRRFTSRLDSFPPEGIPGTDTDFAREQLLDEFGLTAAILNPVDSLGAGNAPVELEVEIMRAINDIDREVWFEADPRWRASVVVAADHPEAAAKEIDRCASQDDRFVQVLLSSRTERPAGNPRYWPIFEAAEHHNLPVAFHVASTKYHGWTGVGPASYYYELHVGFPLPAQSLASSMVFEGVFERFPGLRVVATELGWEWAAPLAWRMDASWRVMRDEVSHLQRKPSEYFSEHFYFSTQPCAEPENLSDYNPLYAQFRSLFGDHLMFATDYPHWDMDSPFEAIPPFLSLTDKEKILAGNASALYGISIETPAVAGAR
jgi:uncharacterized protein